MKLPSSPLEYQPSNETAARRLIETADDNNFKKRQDVVLGAGERLVLRAPNGTLWKIAVSNAGVLSASAYP